MSNFSCNNLLTDFVEQDFAKSGIPDYVCRSYKNLGYDRILLFQRNPSGCDWRWKRR